MPRNSDDSRADDAADFQLGDMTNTAAPTHALSICEPWAWAVAAGFKTIENRTWRTKHRGPLAIHASQSQRHLNDDACNWLCDVSPAIKAALNDERLLVDEPPGRFTADNPAPGLFFFGAIIGVVDLYDCVAFDVAQDDLAVAFAHLDAPLNPLAIPHATWAGGPWCFALRNARRLRRPVPCAGKVNVWRMPDDVREAVAAAVVTGNWLLDGGEPAVQPRGWSGGLPFRT